MIVILAPLVILVPPFQEQLSRYPLTRERILVLVNPTNLSSVRLGQTMVIAVGLERLKIVFLCDRALALAMQKTLKGRQGLCGGERPARTVPLALMAFIHHLETLCPLFRGSRTIRGLESFGIS